MKKTMILLILMSGLKAQARQYPHELAEQLPPDVVILQGTGTVGKRPPHGYDYIKYRRRDCVQDMFQCQKVNLWFKDCEAEYINCRNKQEACRAFDGFHAEYELYSKRATRSGDIIDPRPKAINMGEMR